MVRDVAPASNSSLFEFLEESLSGAPQVPWIELPPFETREGGRDASSRSMDLATLRLYLEGRPVSDAEDGSSKEGVGVYVLYAILSVPALWVSDIGEAKRRARPSGVEDRVPNEFSHGFCNLTGLCLSGSEGR